MVFKFLGVKPPYVLDDIPVENLYFCETQNGRHYHGALLEVASALLKTKEGRKKYRNGTFARTGYLVPLYSRIKLQELLRVSAGETE